ncbi:MAG TPA: TonB-dependent receptor [Bryobacteraceae bacterium]|nr:TonB-dependent receptor [Bryobacteraceae bacterium]
MRRSMYGVAVLLSLAAVCMGQDSRGSITGTITDPQKALIPGAAVTVTNTETNVSSHVTTNANGYYEVDLLNPGTYSIAAEAQGFKKTVRAGIKLSVSDRLGVNLELQVGEATQTIEVTAAAPLLDTTSAMGGKVLDNREITQLPFSSMNPMALTAISPGMQFTGTIGLTRVFDNAGAGSYSSNGDVGTSNEYLLDGAPVTGTNGARVGFTPSSEAVDEVRVETSPFDASMGHTSGTFVSATTKSGTNTYHGSLFDQHWQNRWNATPHFTRLAYQAGLANGTVKPGSEEQPSGRSNQFGFSIGGPVRIPKVINGRNKLFFFFQYDGIRQLQPNPNTPNYTVPTDAERQGDFSALLGVDATKYTIYDPRTAFTKSGHVTRLPFPGNKGIPILNPAYKAWMQVYPEPNNVPGIVQPDGTNNYYDPSQPYNDYFNSIVNRYDYNLNDRQRLSGKWYWNHRHQNAYDWSHTTPLSGLMSNGLVRLNKGGSGDYIYAINSNNVLDVSVSLTRYSEGSEKPIQTKFNAADFGLPAYVDTKAGGFDDIPAFTISGISDVASSGIAQYPSISQRGTTGQVKLQMTTIHGSHSLKYGLDERRYYYASSGAGYPTGHYTFDKTYTQQADNTTTASNTGLGFAAFLMGLPSGITLNTNDTGYYSTRYHALYVQDDYRVTSRLRFGFGLRFEREGGSTERFDRGLSGGFDFSYKPAYADAVQAAYAQNPLAQLPASQFNVLGGVYYLGQPYGNYTDGTNRFLPNVSTVYQLTDKTVLRAGYGWFADTFNAVATSGDRGSQAGYSQATNTTLTTDNGLTFCCGVGAAASLSSANPMQDPFPVRGNGTRFDLPYGNSLGADIQDGRSFTLIPRDYAPALQQRWRIGVQREITRNQMIDISYNGAYATTPVTEKLSYLPSQYWATGNTRDNAADAAMTAKVANPFLLKNFAGLQASNPTLYDYLATNSWFTGTTLQTQQLLRAYPNMAGGLSESDHFRGKNWYHDMQAVFTRRFSHGFQTSVMYTRAYGQTQFVRNEFDQSLSWEPNNNVRPHRFVWSAVWELPFGKGRAFLSSGVLQHIVGGWQVSWIYQYQDGTALGFSNRFYYGDLDQIASVLNHDQVHSKNIHQWFDPTISYNPLLNSSASATGAIPDNFVGFEGRSAFQPGTYQVRVFPNLLDSVRADGIHNWDTKLYRRFVIHERLNFNFSVDLLNMTNHTNFGTPNLDPTSTNFGRVTSQSGSPRQIQLNLRIDF